MCVQVVRKLNIKYALLVVLSNIEKLLQICNILRGTIILLQPSLIWIFIMKTFVMTNHSERLKLCTVDNGFLRSNMKIATKERSFETIILIRTLQTGTKESPTNIFSYLVSSSEEKTIKKQSSEKEKMVIDVVFNALKIVGGQESKKLEETSTEQKFEKRNTLEQNYRLHRSNSKVKW